MSGGPVGGTENLLSLEIRSRLASQRQGWFLYAQGLTAIRITGEDRALFRHVRRNRGRMCSRTTTIEEAREPFHLGDRLDLCP